MPLGEIAGEIAGGLARLVAHFVLEIVLELLIKGPGYLICRQFSSSVNPDGTAVWVAGLLVWTLLGVGAYALFTFILA